MRSAHHRTPGRRRRRNGHIHRTRRLFDRHLLRQSRISPTRRRPGRRECRPGAADGDDHTLERQKHFALQRAVQAGHDTNHDHGGNDNILAYDHDDGGNGINHYRAEYIDDIDNGGNNINDFYGAQHINLVRAANHDDGGNDIKHHIVSYINHVGKFLDHGGNDINDDHDDSRRQYDDKPAVIDDLDIACRNYLDAPRINYHVHPERILNLIELARAVYDAAAAAVLGDDNQPTATDVGVYDDAAAILTAFAGNDAALRAYLHQRAIHDAQYGLAPELRDTATTYLNTSGDRAE